MKKKDIILDTLTAASTQAVTLATVTSPVKSVLAVTAVALMSGISKQLIVKRNIEIEELANELSDSRLATEIKKIKEEQFIDDLTYSVEKILTQRTKPKRILMRNVFLGYLKAEHKTSYPLEKMYSVVENLTFADIDFLRRVMEASEIRAKYAIPYASKDIMDNHAVPIIDQDRMIILSTSNDNQDAQSKISLINEGLLVEQRRGVGTWGGGEGTPQLYVTALGNYFKSYLLEVNDL